MAQNVTEVNDQKDGGGEEVWGDREKIWHRIQWQA